jgi:drug/metabolite transporter (DMT)-like permease
LVSTYAYVNPVVAVFLGWVILGEPVTWLTVAAGALIVGAVALIVSRPDGRRGTIVGGGATSVAFGTRPRR